MNTDNHDPFALGGVQADPIFAAIEEYQGIRHEMARLYEVWSEASPNLDETHPTFAPYLAAWNRWCDGGVRLTKIHPTTLRGVSALLDFTRELIGDDDGTHDACIEMAIDEMGHRRPAATSSSGRAGHNRR